MACIRSALDCSAEVAGGFRLLSLFWLALAGQKLLLSTHRQQMLIGHGQCLRDNELESSRPHGEGNCTTANNKQPLQLFPANMFQHDNTCSCSACYLQSFSHKAGNTKAVTLYCESQ